MLSIISIAVNLVSLAIIVWALVRVARTRRRMDAVHTMRMAQYAVIEAAQVEAAFQLLDAQAAQSE